LRLQYLRAGYLASIPWSRFVLSEAIRTVVARRQRPADSQPNPRTVRAAALALLSRRDYTAAEIDRKLIEKGYDREAVAGAIAALTSSRLLDDRRVAAAHVRTATAVKGRGRLRIARELSARGISRDLVRDVLADLPQGDELTMIRRILARKRWPANPTRADRQRMYRHLVGKGFRTDEIFRALGNPDEDD
jgi:regulatory protein